MKIGMVVENIPSGVISGGRYHAMFAGCGLTELGHDVTMLTNHNPQFLDLFELYNLPKIQKTNIRNLKDGNFELILSYPILATEIGASFAKKLSVPHWAFVLDCESLCKKYAPAVGNRMHFGERHTAALRNSDRLLSISEYAVPFIKEWTGNENTIGLMGCVNSREADSVWTEGQTRFVAITRLTEHKRLDDLCLVAKRLNVKIDLITSFGKQAVENRLAAKSVQAQVTIWDSPDDKTKFKLMKLAQALLCPSAYEGLGMPMMEALYCGKPVICYDYGVMREVCEDAAMYAAWSSPESFTRQVETFLKDDFKKLDLEMAARRIGPRYSFEAMCKRLKDVFGVGDLWI